MKTIKFFAVFLIFLFLFSPLKTHCEDQKVGNVISSENDVSIVREDKTITGLGPLMPLYAGDRIITGEGGKIVFSLSSGSRFTVGESSEISIDEFSSITSEEAKSSTAIRLVLGFLHSVIKKDSNEIKPVIQTPTAILGIRGTEFDTAVALDTATAVAVDEGSVEIGWEDKTSTVKKGELAKFDVETGPGQPLKAPPKNKRNWRAWLKQHKANFADKLPEMIVLYKKRFEKKTDKYILQADKVKKVCSKLSEKMDEIRLLAKRRKRAKLRRAMKKFRSYKRALLKNIGKMRVKFNTSKAISRHCTKIIKFTKKNRDKFTKKELELIKSNISAINAKAKELKKIQAETRELVKEIVKEISSFRKEILKKKMHGRS